MRGTVNNWGVDERYKLTTTDGNYYVATYTKGNEVEIGDVNGGTAEFKIGSGNSDYSPINFGGNKVIERGGSYRLTSKGVNLKVNYTTSASNEDMYAKLSGGAVSYDVIVPSDYMIQRLIKENKLEELNNKKQKIADEISAVNEQFRSFEEEASKISSDFEKYSSETD